MTAPFDLDAIEAKALSVSEELCARVEMKDPSLLSRFHPTERERAALFFRGARATTLRLVERIRELEASLTRETETIARLHETIAGVTDLHARDLHAVAHALGLVDPAGWDINEITKRATEEHTARKSYEEGIAWETSCLHCASTLTSCREAEERAEAAEAIIAGRTVAPTDAEIAAHAMVDGRWLVGGREWHLFINDEGRLVLRRPGFVECVGTVARDRVDTHAGCRWIAIDINCPCAWPVVAETAK